MCEFIFQNKIPYTDIYAHFKTNLMWKNTVKGKVHFREFDWLQIYHVFYHYIWM